MRNLGLASTAKLCQHTIRCLAWFSLLLLSWNYEVIPNPDIVQPR